MKRMAGISLLVAFAALGVQASPTHARSAASRATISDVTVVEGDSGTTKAIFRVTLSNGAGARVHYETRDRSATAGSDYEEAKGTLKFRNGQTVRRIVVTVFGDTASEADERFRVILSNASGATIADHRGVGTILDDDGSETSRRSRSATPR